MSFLQLVHASETGNTKTWEGYIRLRRHFVLASYETLELLFVCIGFLGFMGW